ncbi:SURF1 family protein [Rhizobacter sp. LjRoot28]|jgi:surfeit locus 1 family protein|uniref:SURF1 family protein n=1 Tax=Rhizobacter sp. LjRoot28 TaxID=3342309 RepID=UPI003ECC5ED1
MAPRGPRWRQAVVLLATLVGVAVTARLGLWQLDRAGQKAALQAALDARAGEPALAPSALAASAEEAVGQHYRRVRLRGEWVPSHTLFLENRQMKGQPGFFVVTPLRLPGDAGAVLVQRGWAPRDIRDRQIVPEVPTPEGPVEVLGQVAPPPGRLYEFDGTAASGPIRQNLDVAQFALETGLALRPLSVVQVEGSPAAAGDGLRRDWPAPAVDIQKHHGYAFQWFALCALMTGLYVWFQLIRPRLPSRAR